MALMNKAGSDIPAAVNDIRDPQFLAWYKSVQQKKMKSELTDEDLLVCACEEISRSYTHQEKNYSL